jgi:hypothetical protein
MMEGTGFRVMIYLTAIILIIAVGILAWYSGKNDDD